MAEDSEQIIGEPIAKNTSGNESYSDSARRHEAMLRNPNANPDLNPPWWKSKWAKIVGGTAAAAVATGAATGTLDDMAGAVDGSIDKVNNAVDNLQNDISSEYTTPREMVTRLDVKIEGLNGRRQPNTVSDKVDWKDLKLVTVNFNPEANKMEESLLDLSNADGFSVENAYIVHGQSAEGGGPGHGDKWGKVMVEEKDGDRYYVYFNVSGETFMNVRSSGPFVNIDYHEKDGTTMVKPSDPTDKLPAGQPNHVVELKNTEVQTSQ